MLEAAAPSDEDQGEAGHEEADAPQDRPQGDRRRRAVPPASSSAAERPETMDT